MCRMYDENIPNTEPDGITPICFNYLMSKYSIRIPMIQREYAQGRDDEDGNEVRKNFVPALIDFLVYNNTKLELDFIFGIKEVKDNNEKPVFIPLDGQQRLTTLLLLHWYLGLVQNGWKFEYEMRRVADSFCSFLLKTKSPYQNRPPEAEVSPDKWIKGQDWFNDYWLKSPTVKGMLTMLASIHSVFTKKRNVKTCFQQRINKLVFYLKTLDDTQADQAYKKMNARGKALTKWENIKAAIVKVANGKYPDWNKNYSSIIQPNVESWLLPDEISEKIDNDKDDEAFEDAIKKLDDITKGSNMGLRNIFDMSMMITYCSNQDLKDDELRKILSQKECFDCSATDLSKTGDELKKILSNDKLALIRRLFHSHEALISDYKIFVTKNSLKLSQNLYNSLKEKESWLQNYWADNLLNNGLWSPHVQNRNGFIEDFLKKEDYSFKSIVKFYAICCISNEQIFERILNLIINSDISNDNFPSVIKTITDFSQSKSYADFVSIANGLKTSGFDGQQFNEEIEKAKMIMLCRRCLDFCNNCGGCTVDGPSWEEKIKTADKYAFFNGCIRFLYRDGNGDVNWQNFDKKWENVQKYFNSEGIKQDFKHDARLLKAFSVLCKDDNLFYKITYSNSKDSWRKMLVSTDFIKPVHELLMMEEIRFTFEQTDNNELNNLLYILPEIDTDNDPWWIYRDWQIYRIPGCVALSSYKRREPKPNRNECAKWIHFIYDPRMKLLNNTAITIRRSKVGALDIDFEYTLDNQIYFFRWYGTPRENDEDVYLMREFCENGHWKRANFQEGEADIEKYYCFKVENLNDADGFCKKLNDLINGIESAKW